MFFQIYQNFTFYKCHGFCFCLTTKERAEGRKLAFIEPLIRAKNYCFTYESSEQPCKRVSDSSLLIVSSGAHVELSTLHMLINLGSFRV